MLRLRSNALWATFNNTESGLVGRERHVVGHDRVSQALEGERTNLFGGDVSLKGDIDALAEQDLAVLGLSAPRYSARWHCAPKASWSNASTA